MTPLSKKSIIFSKKHPLIAEKGGLGLKDYIKKESFYAISRLVFELTVSGVSRREIAERCNFSQMTVGKVISRLAEKGLVSQIRAEHSKGRHAQLVTPSGKIRYLLANVSQTRWTASLTDFKGDTVFRKSSTLDPSMSYKDNFQDILHGTLRANVAPDGIVFASLVREFTPEEDISEIALPRSCTHLLSTEQGELVKRHVSRRFRRYNSIYIGIFGKECSLMIFEKSKLLASVSFEINELDSGEAQDYLLHRTKELLSSHSFSPDTLVFESGAVASVFANAIYDKIKNSLDEKGYSLPRTVKYEDMRFSNEEALFLLRKQTAHTVTDMFYNENK